MNSNKKIEEIEIILDYYKKKICPYCGEDLVPFLSGAEKKLGCDNNHESLEIHEIDYLSIIGNIVKYSTPSIDGKFKLITEF